MEQPKFSCDIPQYQLGSRNPSARWLCRKMKSWHIFPLLDVRRFFVPRPLVPRSQGPRGPQLPKNWREDVQCQPECLWFHDIHHTWPAGSACTWRQIHSFQRRCHFGPPAWLGTTKVRTSRVGPNTWSSWMRHGCLSTRRMHKFLRCCRYLAWI